MGEIAFQFSYIARAEAARIKQKRQDALYYGALLVAAGAMVSQRY